MKITKKDIKRLDEGKVTARELFPDVFEEKFTGWAKRDMHPLCLMYYVDNKPKYGLGNRGTWTYGYVTHYDNQDFRPATDQEILEALTKEAVKRGFVEGARINNTNMGYKLTNCLLESGSYYFDKDRNILDIDCSYVFIDGKWANVIPQAKEMTVKEIEKELGHTIKIIK